MCNERINQSRYGAGEIRKRRNWRTRMMIKKNDILANRRKMGIRKKEKKSVEW